MANHHEWQGPAALQQATLKLLAAELGLDVQALRIEALLADRLAVFYEQDGVTRCACALDSDRWRQAQAQVAVASVVGSAFASVGTVFSAMAEPGSPVSDPVTRYFWFDPTRDAMCCYQDEATALRAADQFETLRVRAETRSGRLFSYRRTQRGWFRDDGVPVSFVPGGTS